MSRTIRITLSTAVLLVLTLMPAAPLASQEAGDTVRVSGDLTAQFIRADSTGLYLSSGFVRYDDITSLELKVGTRSLWLKGMLVGTGVGAGVGLVLAATNCFYDDPGAFSLCHFAGAVGLAGLFGIPGGVLGTLAGAGMQTDRFAPILLPTVRPGTRMHRDRRLGLSLGGRWRF